MTPDTQDILRLADDVEPTAEERAAHAALDQLAGELCAEPTVELDWQRIEAQLMSRLAEADTRPSVSDIQELGSSRSTARSDAEAPPARARASRVWPAVAVAVAATVALAAGFAFNAQRVPPPPQAAAPVAASLDGDRLTVGQLIRSEGTPLVVEHAGRASWTLAPGGRARLVSVGRYLTVRLEQGSIDARVVPRNQPESFAVQAGETRIAVRGTEFRVDLMEQHAAIKVAHGTVVVGAVGEPGDTDGWVLRAPASGEFSLDGAVRAARLTGGVSQPTSAAEPIVGPIEPTSKPSSPRPASGLSLDAALEHVAAAAQACFKQKTPSEGGVLVSASTRLKIAVAADGKLGSISFDPPLSPAVEDCTRAQRSAVQVTPGKAREAARVVWLGQSH